MLAHVNVYFSVCILYLTSVNLIKTLQSTALKHGFPICSLWSITVSSKVSFDKYFEFTILTTFQAALLFVRKKTPGRRHGLTTRGWWVVRQFQLWFEESWVLWSPSGECTECLGKLCKVTYFVMNTSYNTTSDTD